MKKFWLFDSQKFKEISDITKQLSSNQQNEYINDLFLTIKQTDDTIKQLNQKILDLTYMIN